MTTPLPPSAATQTLPARPTLSTPAPAVAQGGAALPGEPVDDRPHTVFELLTRQMLEQVKSDLKEVKDRVNALLWLVAGATLLEVLSRLLG